jgi:phosphatidylglycerophosphate synthase
MHTVPTSRPEIHRGASVAAGAGLLGLSMLGRAMAVSTGHLVIAGVVFAGVMAVAVRAVTRHHPHARFGPANLVTTARVALTAIIVGAAWDAPRPALAWWIVWLATMASVLDGIDGWLARRTRLQSAFGARFDMEIDALLTLGLAVLVWRFDKAGAWVLGCGLMRYGFVAARWAWPWLGGELSPTIRGKTVAVLQFIALAAAIAPLVPRHVSSVMAAAALTVLTWSFAMDVGRLWRARGPI